MYHLDPSNAEHAAKIEELRKRFPGRRMHRLRADIAGREVVVYVREASREEYNRFKREAIDDRTKAKALEQMTTGCVIHPEPAAWQSILAEYPGLAETFGENLLEYAGLNIRAEAQPF
jgi:hypothetical protein